MIQSPLNYTGGKYRLPVSYTHLDVYKRQPWISASDLYRSCGYSFEEFRDSIRWKIHQMDPKDQIHAGNLELERTFKELINSREIYADWKEMVHDYRARFETCLLYTSKC